MRQGNLNDIVTTVESEIINCGDPRRDNDLPGLSTRTLQQDVGVSVVEDAVHIKIADIFLIYENILQGIAIVECILANGGHACRNGDCL